MSLGGKLVLLTNAVKIFMQNLFALLVYTPFHISCLYD
jgi:hypothetical protein